MISPDLFLISPYVINFYAGPSNTLPITDLYLSDPNLTYRMAENITASWRNKGDTFALFPACALLTKLAGYNVRAGILTDVYKEKVLTITGENPLGKYIFDRAKKLRKGQRDTLQMIPQHIPRSVNRILTALLDVYLSVAEKPHPRVMAYVWDSLGLKDKKVFERENLIKDLSVKAYAFQISCILLDSLRSALKREGASVKSLTVSTPWGNISFGGQENDSFPPSIIVVDAGGDDIYDDVVFGIDLAGNDIHRGKTAAGIFSVSAFVDLGGDDVYEGEGMGNGFLGFGVLLDLSGDDTYRGKVFTQGAGYSGGGALIDLSGNDSYYAYQKAQGFGWIRGVGILADLSGRDSYKMEDSLIVFPAPQDPKHNASLGQGMGFGERRDFYDGKSLAGGVGMLLDGGGDDMYSAGIFAQGSGYWMGTGILYDASGNDAYSGVWYVQGASAHFAIGVLYDKEGKDVYYASRSTSQGVGHDFSYGILIDGLGRDTYTCGNLCLGSGNAQGVGILWDQDGDMKVNLRGKGLGYSNPAVDSLRVRALFPTKGVVCKGKTCP